MANWEMVIGLEVHVQLSTVSKLFSGASTQFGQPPNTQACSIDLGLPGVLPTPNVAAIRKGVAFGLAVGAEVQSYMQFERKNYFYPDLPKGYQITQMDKPVVSGGSLTISLADGSAKTVNITRAHLEEDAGKLMHDGAGSSSAVDLNRAGVPLLEIVSEPEIRSEEEAVAYLKSLHKLIRWIGISNGEMAQGSMRCDVNISVKPEGSEKLGTRAEIKNVNSFRFVEKAITYEFHRQCALLDAGQEVVQETRLYDSTKDETRSMRTKEEAQDYRYFPDPDLVPVQLPDGFIDAVKDALPELPEACKQRFVDQYQLSDKDATSVTSTAETARYFEVAVASLASTDMAMAKTIVNWIMGALAAQLNEHQIDIAESPVTAERLAGLVDLIANGTISSNIAKEVFQHMWKDRQDAQAVVEALNLTQMGDEGEIRDIINQVLAENPTQLEQYRSGKDRLFGFFVGQVMKATKGKADPKKANQLLQEILKS